MINHYRVEASLYTAKNALLGLPPLVFSSRSQADFPGLAHDLISASTRKSLSQPHGTLSLTLWGRCHEKLSAVLGRPVSWSEIARPMDVIQLALSINGRPYEVLMQGPITDVSMSVVSDGSGAVRDTVEVQAADFGYYLTRWEVWLNPYEFHFLSTEDQGQLLFHDNLRGRPDQLGLSIFNTLLFQNSLGRRGGGLIDSAYKFSPVVEAGMRPGDDVLTKAARNFEELRQGKWPFLDPGLKGFDLRDRFRFFSSIRAEEWLRTEFAKIMSMQGAVWNTLKQIANEPWNEMFVDNGSPTNAGDPSLEVSGGAAIWLPTEDPPPLAGGAAFESVRRTGIDDPEFDDYDPESLPATGDGLRDDVTFVFLRTTPYSEPERSRLVVHELDWRFVLQVGLRRSAEDAYTWFMAYPEHYILTGHEEFFAAGVGRMAREGEMRDQKLGSFPAGSVPTEGDFERSFQEAEFEGYDPRMGSEILTPSARFGTRPLRQPSSYINLSGLEPSQIAANEEVGIDAARRLTRRLINWYDPLPHMFSGSLTYVPGTRARRGSGLGGDGVIKVGHGILLMRPRGLPRMRAYVTNVAWNWAFGSSCRVTVGFQRGVFEGDRVGHTSTSEQLDVERSTAVFAEEFS